MRRGIVSACNDEFRGVQCVSGTCVDHEIKKIGALQKKNSQVIVASDLGVIKT